jgi:hypothetical protein
MIELDWLYTFSYTLDITLTHQILRNMVLCFGILTLLLILPNLQFLFARQIPLSSIDGKNHLMEVEWANEQVAVDDRTKVELTVVSPIMTDPINTEADTTQPITGLENSLKVDTLAESKILSSEVEPALIFLMHESGGIW